MRNGIIQDIIQEYINMETNAKKKGYSQMHVDYELVLTHIQEQLINTIKREFTKDMHFVCMSKLIGDAYKE